MNTPVTLEREAPEQLQAKFEAALAEAKIAASFRDLVELKCDRHREYDEKCVACRKTLAWELFREYWRSAADKEHDKMLGIDKINEPEGQAKFMRARETERLYRAQFGVPLQLGSEGNRTRLRLIIAGLRERISRVKQPITE